MAHDEWIYLLAQAVGRVVFLPDVLALHREHGENAAGIPAGGVRLVSAALGTGSSRYRNLAFRAQEFAEFFAAAAASPPALVDSARLRTAEAAYRSVAVLWEARSRIYAPGRSSRGRTSELVQIFRRGGYRSRLRGGLGRRALLKDTVTSLLGGLGARKEE